MRYLLVSFQSWLLIGFLCWCTVGCVADVRRWREPDTRMTDQTAHVLPEGRIEIGAGLVGTRIENLGASLPVRYGVTDEVEVSSNVGHLALGILNVQAEWSFYERKNVAFALRGGVSWLNPEFFWWIPVDLRDALADVVEIVLVPVEFMATLPVTSHLDTTLTLGYTHAAALGNVRVDSAHAEGQFGTRDLSVGASFSYILSPWIAVNLGAKIPFWAASHVNAAGESELAPGVVLGVVTNELIEHDIAGLYSVELSVVVRRDDAWLRVGLIQNYRFITGTVPFPIPSVDAAWRF